MRQKTIHFHTQGCRLNQSETATLQQVFENDYRIVGDHLNADIVVINTCTVTENGDSDTRRLINKINLNSPDTKIALIGCQSQILKEKLLEYKNVQWVIGNQEKMSLKPIIDHTWDSKTPTILVNKIKRDSFTVEKPSIDLQHTRPSLKIQDGCDFYCSFCVIPFARGPARSRVFSDILSEAKTLALLGYSEIVLTGINVGTYQDEKYTFLDVIKALEEIEGIKRIRISSIEPTTVPLELFQHMITGKVCPYLHLPIQSGSDAVLKAMSRKYTVSQYRDFVLLAKSTVKNLCLGTDVIVGFPLETQEYFDETVLQLMTLPIDYFHVFRYSERKFARSQKFSKIHSLESKKRSQILRTLSQKKRLAFHQSYLNTEEEILVEHEKQGWLYGMTKQFIKVKFQGQQMPKNLVKVRLLEAHDTHMVGQLI